MNALLERLAALEHEQWVTWSQALASDPHEKLTPERLARWHRLWVPYDQLSKEDKERDREWARKVLLTFAGLPLDTPLAEVR